MTSPRVFEVSRSQGNEYSPIFYLNDTPSRPISFELPNNVPVTPITLTLMWYSDEFLNNLAAFSNEYAKQILSSTPEMWHHDISCGEISVFFSILYYVGIVQCPDKDDCWSSNSIMPSHSLMNLMTRTRFRYTWQYVHCFLETIVR